MAGVEPRVVRQPVDQDRQLRLILAWLAGDKPAFDLVLDEAMKDPTGVPGLLFSLVDFATRLGTEVAPATFVERLQQRLPWPARRRRRDDHAPS